MPKTSMADLIKDKKMEEKHMKEKKNLKIKTTKENKNRTSHIPHHTSPRGITLIALVITIIVILILATVTINIAINGGLFGYAKKAKEQTEIAGEKEIIGQAIILAIGKDKQGNIEEKNLQDEFDNLAGYGKVLTVKNGNEIEAYFIDSNRCYQIDINGKVIGYETAVQDENPGDITKGGRCDGSKEKPFEINCIEDLVVFSNLTKGTGIKLENGVAEQITKSETFENKYVVLKRTLNFKSIMSYINMNRTDFGDINGDSRVDSLKTEMTTENGFLPINNFAGYFDGGTHEIQNIYINREEAALFGNAKKIENLGISGEIVGTRLAAGICISSQEINNCYNKANIKGEDKAAGIGGSGKIINCYNSGNVTGKTMAGGILYGIAYDIENCYNTGDIKSTGNYVGGIASGHPNGKSTIIGCYNTGNISGAASSGGILGTSGASVSSCYNTGKVSGKDYVAGIVGASCEEITNCYNLGDIITTNSSGHVAGINGKDAIKVTNCYNIGKIQGGEISGIIGSNSKQDAVISNCFNTGELVISPNYNKAMGGILGYNTGTITINNCYSMCEMSKLNSSWTVSVNGIIGKNTGTANLNKCYYMKNSMATSAVYGVEDSAIDVVVIKDKSELTATILNSNIDIIEHIEEWKKWEDGEEYPIIKY